MFIVGFLVVGGILNLSFSLKSKMPTGYVVLPDKPSCCDDCSCLTHDVCITCKKCVWATECTELKGTLRPNTLKLVYAGGAVAGSSFSLNAMVKGGKKDSHYLLELDLPNGFASENKNPVVIEVKAGEITVIPFVIDVKEHVAEQEHVIAGRLTSPVWKTVSVAQAKVEVSWDNSNQGN